MKKQDWINAHFDGAEREQVAVKLANVGDEINYVRSEDGGAVYWDGVEGNFELWIGDYQPGAMIRQYDEDWLYLI